MVPWLAAGITSGRALARAPRRTSVMRWEVSTLPAATAAGGRGFTKLPSGATTVTGRRMPWLDGRGLADDAAEDVEGSGEGDCKRGVDAPPALGAGLGEVQRHGIAADGDGDGDGHGLVGQAVVVHDVAEGVVAVGQGADGGSGEALGVVEEGGLVLVDDGPSRSGRPFPAGDARRCGRRRSGRRGRRGARRACGSCGRRGRRPPD